MRPVLEPIRRAAPSGGHRFCLWHAPGSGVPNGLVVQVHAFAEEMNKSRRMAAVQSRRLAERGFAVLQMDLRGCGDSDGDFSDARWSDWTSDVRFATDLASELARDQWPQAQPARWLWGHRAGCLLATEAAHKLDGAWNLLFWQPVISGKAALQQFLRLDSLGAVASGSSNKPDRPSAKSELAAGRIAEVAGYRLNPELTRGFEAARLLPPDPPARMFWLDMGGKTPQPASPANSASMLAWRQAGWDVVHMSVQGPSFWQTVEIEDAPDLWAATEAALSKGGEAQAAQVEGGAA